MNKRLQALLAKFNAKKESVEAILAGDEELTEEQEAEVEAITAEMGALRTQIEGLTKLQNDISSSTSFVEGLSQGMGRQTQAAKPDATGRIEGGTPVFAKDANWGYESAANFAVDAINFSKTKSIEAVGDNMRGIFNAAPSNFHKLIASDDGLMAPPQMINEMFEAVEHVSDLHNDADVESTSADVVQLLADESTPWGSSGIKSYYIKEAGQMSGTRLVTEGRECKLHKQYVFVTATEELRADAPRLAGRLTSKSAEAFAWTRSEAIMRGTGVGEPLGVLNSDAVVTVAKDSGQTAGTLTLSNILNMYERTLEQGNKAFKWYMNKSLLKYVFQLTIGDQPIWTPPGMLAGSPNGSILGLPIEFNKHTSAAGSVGDIMLANLKGYLHPQRTGAAAFASSMHLYFDYDVMAFRWTHRNGGMPYLSAPVSPPDGSSLTMSDFVLLAERA